MLYAILFGLDFYQSLKTVFIVIQGLYFLGLVLSLFIISILTEAYYSYDKAVRENHEYYIKFYLSEAMTYKSCKGFIKKWWIGVLVTLTFFAPSKETVYIATGLYVGESMYNDYKDTPLAKKAYNLAEMKLNELLDEKLNESCAENGNSKK